MTKQFKIKIISIIRKLLLYVVPILTFSTNLFAQTKVGETCEKQLEDARAQLRSERALKQAALDAKKELENAHKSLQDIYEEMEEELTTLKTSLYETETALQNALVKIESYGEDESKLTERYEDQLKLVSADKLILQTDLNRIRQELSDMDKKHAKLSTTLSAFQNSFPFFVTDIEFKNTDKTGITVGNFRESLKRKKMYWLTAKVSYTSLMDEPKDIQMKIKIFMPDGSLWSDSNVSISFKAASNQEGINQMEGSFLLNEWIGQNGKSIFPVGKFTEGRYRVEIWHSDFCVGTKTFVISN